MGAKAAMAGWQVGVEYQTGDWVNGEWRWLPRGTALLPSYADALEFYNGCYQWMRPRIVWFRPVA